MFTLVNSVVERQKPPQERPKPLKEQSKYKTSVEALQSAASLALGDVSLDGVVRTYKAWSDLSHIPTKIAIAAGSVLGGFVAHSLLTSIVAFAVPLLKLTGTLLGGVAVANHYIECWAEKKTLEFSLSALPEHLLEMWNAFTLKNIKENFDSWQQMEIKHELGTIASFVGGIALSWFLANGFFAVVPRLLLCQLLTADSTIFSFSTLQYAKSLVKEGLEEARVEMGEIGNEGVV